MNDYILFITEGKLPEKSIINSIENNYLSSNIEIIQYSTTIYKLHEEIKNNIIETFARNSPFARGIPPNRKKTKNGNEISKTMAKSWIKSPNGC